MKIDRLLGIITTLLQKGKVTAPYLAEKFEVSRRTILRDLDDICKAGIPIVTTQGGDGGIAIAEGYKLDKSVLTTSELQSIVAGLRSIEGIEKTANIERLVQKFAPGVAAPNDGKPYDGKPYDGAVVSLRDSIVIDLASHYKNDLSEKIGLIKDAINTRQLIEFDYYYSKGISHRIIEPYFIAFKWSAWYVFGYCTERQDFRIFKLNRLWELKLSDTGYAVREIPPERLELDGNLADSNAVTLLFDPGVRYRLIEDYGFKSFAETDDGKLLFHIGYTNKDYIIAWILAYGDQVKVLSPPELAEDLKQIAKNIYDVYCVHDI